MIRLAEVCANHLCDAAEANRNIWVLDGDLGDSYGLQRFVQLHSDRFIPAGIAEQNMVSMAAGMAACGARPCVFSFACFLAYRAADQIRVSIAQTQLPVILIGSHAGGLAGRNGKTHQAIGDISVIRSLSGIDIWAPCDSKDAIFALESILNRTVPSYIRTPRELVPDLPGTPGAVRWLTPRSDNVIVCSGMSAVWALEVYRQLSADFRISVIHVASVHPLEPELLSIIATANSWFTIEDHVRAGGLADAISVAVQDQPDGWFGWPADWAGGSGEPEALRKEAGITSSEIKNRVAGWLQKQSQKANVS